MAMGPIFGLGIFTITAIQAVIRSRNTEESARYFADKSEHVQGPPEEFFMRDHRTTVVDWCVCGCNCRRTSWPTPFRRACAHCRMGPIVRTSACKPSPAGREAVPSLAILSASRR